MKIQRILALTKKEMKKTIREPAVLFMIFLFPIIFVVAFGTSFGGSAAETLSTISEWSTLTQAPTLQLFTAVPRHPN